MKTENNIAPGVISDQIPVIGFAECVRCGKCIAACPKEAIFMVPNPVCGKCMGYCLMLPMR